MPLKKTKNPKKWTGSRANMYISRSKASKKLQLSLPAFRKLCILKGIYPHDPKKKHKREGDRRVYYHRKDIKLLHREPILWQWRNQKTFRDRITKHKGRHNWDKVKRMQLNLPQISLDHLVRERYPIFTDALRDLDDCVTFIFLFSTLPSGIIPQLTALRRLECQKLCKEFRNYIIAHGLLTKAFISVKGIYYQCRLRNKYDITWIVPHGFAHSIPDDVDYRVMSTFLDFYQTMLRFVVYKLYKDAHMRYPPFGHIDYDLTNLSLTALMAKKFSVKRKINVHKRKKNKKSETKTKSVSESTQKSETETKTNVSKNSKVVKLDLSQILDESALNNEESIAIHDFDNKYSRKSWDRSNLFEDFKFLLNRETPQFELEFVILSMGGQCVFQQDCPSVSDSDGFTHQIIDRVVSEDSVANTREYVQPQWVFDCLNTGAVVPTEHYQMGIQCPPHLSPFVAYNDQSHIPSQQFVLEHWKKVSKRFGGFVPSKKLRKSIKEKSASESEKEIMPKKSEKIEMNLDIDTVMDFEGLESNEKNESESEKEDCGSESDGAECEIDFEKVNGKWIYDNGNGNGNSNNNNKASQKKKKFGEKQSVLNKQRIRIANNERRAVKTQASSRGHSLATDGVPGNKEERMKVDLARAMMSKKYRKVYDKIRKNKTRKNKHLKYMDEKRKRFEQKQMHSRH